MHKSRCTYEEKNRLLKHEISVVIGIQMGSSLTKLQEPNGCVGSWLWSLLTVWSWLGQSVWWYRRMEERAPRYYMSDRDADRSCLHKIKTTTEQSPLWRQNHFIVCRIQKVSILLIIYLRIYYKICQRQISLFKMIFFNPKQCIKIRKGTLLIFYILVLNC